MTRRERLRRCYFHQETDRPAVYCRTGFPANDSSYDALKAYLNEKTELKAGWSCTSLESTYPTQTREEPHSEDFKRQITVLKTPKGDLQATNLISLKGQPGLHETHFLKDRQDAEKYLSLPMPALAGSCDPFFEIDRELGDKGITQAHIGWNPGGFVAELFGSETFAIMTLTDRDIVDALCERQMQINVNRVKFMLANRIGPFFAMLGEEYIVPPLHGPGDFNDFNVKYDKPIIDLIHDAGGRVHIHSHGPIKQVFQGFLDMGADVLHPFEGPPMGDITPEEAKRFARGTMTLEGNIQIHHFYEHTPQQIKDETDALIAGIFDDHKGLILCATASPYLRDQGAVCYPQFKAMVDTVINHR